jgi:threonine/homoserine/homoserine lactone efflux protein
MMYVSVPTLAAFVLTCLVIELTPGPNMAYLAVLAVSRGRRAGYAATLGIALGLTAVGVGAALGLAALISSSTVLYEALRWGGVVYLLLLAWEGWCEADKIGSADPATSENDTALFTRGLITNLLNPKATVFYVAILPTFVNAARPVLAQTVLLSLTYVVIATGIHITIVTLAALARPLLENGERLRLVKRCLSAALAFIALWFAVSTAR